jgi:pimeloyl-ACP methyl ester carboxylesterase
VIGHDWGAIAIYSAISLYPKRIRRAVAMAIGHPGSVIRILERPDLIHRAFHFWFFQVPGFSEQAVRHNDFAMIDYLWNLWSPGHQDPEHIKSVKETLAQPGAVEAALGYYRALLQFPMTHPDLAQKIQFDQATVPTLGVFGGNEPGLDLTEDQDKHFAGDYRREVVEGAGHFVQRERPEELTRLLLDWLEG